MSGIGYRRDGMTPERKAALAAALEKFGNVRDACRVAGVSKTTFYRHRASDPDFAARCAEAQPRAAGRLEAVAWKRAVEGTPETVIRDGKVVQVRLKPSDAVLRLLLQAADPGKYGGAVAALREKIAAQIRPEVEAEVRAEIAAEYKARYDPREVRKRLDAKLSDYNRRMGGDG